MTQTIIDHQHNTHCEVHHKPDSRLERSPFKQRLIDLERGLTLSFRGDSIFFVHIFFAILISCTAMVLGATMLHWILLFITAIVILAAEIFHQAFIHISKYLEQHDFPTACKIQKISTAGEMVCIIGASITVIIILTDCALKLW
jgi:diacylglycerol kinase